MTAEGVADVLKRARKEARDEWLNAMHTDEDAMSRILLRAVNHANREVESLECNMEIYPSLFDKPEKHALLARYRDEAEVAIRALLIRDAALKTKGD